MNITAIGFANKFYTLWNITEETKPLGNGHSYIITHYTFIKNISFDKETAIAKYPNAILDENLRGKTISWNTTKEVWDNVDTFRFGKYKYSKITDSDLNYLTWYWDQINGEHKEYVGKILEANGYEIRKWRSVLGYDSFYLVSPEDLEKEKENNEIANILEEKLKAGEIIDFITECNPDSEGDCRIGDVIYHFNEIKENWYSGCPYYLPVLNGKQKRIKNKKINVTKYTYTRNESIITINIEDFVIVK